MRVEELLALTSAYRSRNRSEALGKGYHSCAPDLGPKEQGVGLFLSRLKCVGVA